MKMIEGQGMKKVKWKRDCYRRRKNKREEHRTQGETGLGDMRNVRELKRWKGKQNMGMRIENQTGK